MAKFPEGVTGNQGEKTDILAVVAGVLKVLIGWQLGFPR